MSDMTMTLEPDDNGTVWCPICPSDLHYGQPDYGRELAVQWAATTSIDTTDPSSVSPLWDAHTSAWTIACAYGHTFLTSHDLYDDDENPPAPTWDDIQSWLAGRRPPIIRDHAFKPGLRDLCYECEKPSPQHAQPAESLAGVGRNAG